MRTAEKKVLNGILELPQEIISYLNLKEGGTVLLKTNKDGSVTIRKKNSIASLKGIIKKGETPDFHANETYQFETESEKPEES